MDTRFLMRDGEIRILERERGREGVERMVELVMGMEVPLPRKILEDDGGRGEGAIPEPEPMWAESSLSKIHWSPRADGGCSAIWLRAAMRSA
jgi:hypothetical protein